MPRTVDIRHQLKRPRPAGRTGRSSNKNSNDEQLLSCSFCNHRFDNQASLTHHIANHIRLRKRYFSGSRSSPRFCKGGSYNAEVKSTGNGGKYNFRIRRTPQTVVTQEAMSEKSFPCPHCDQYFTRKTDLTTHVKIHSEKNLTLIPSSTRSHRRGASRQLTGSDGFKCRHCDRSFSKKENMQRHMRTHANEKPFACPSCSRSFNYKSSLNRHITFYKNENPFTCSTSSHSFNRKSILKNHTKTHANKKPFECSDHKSRFRRHIRIHTNEKPFVCSICSHSCRSSALLKRHAMIHTNKRPFSCPSCSRSFNRRGSLVKHIITHTNEKPFSCHSCNHSFNRRENLIRHIRNHCKGVPESYPAHRRSNKRQHHSDNPIEQHTETKHFSCHSCKKSFRVKKNLRIYILTHMEEDSSNQNDNLKTPDCVQSQNILFPCPSCSSSFSQEQDLNLHITTHATILSVTNDQSSNQEEKCDMQPVSSLEQFAFTLPSDSSTSTQKTHFRCETPFSCNNCGQSIAKKISLKKHILEAENDRLHACRINAWRTKPQISTSTNADSVKFSSSGSTRSSSAELSIKGNGAKVKELHVLTSIKADRSESSASTSTETSPSKADVKELHVLTRANKDPSASTETSRSEAKVKEPHVLTPANNDPTASSSSASTKTSKSEAKVKKLHVLTPAIKDPITSSSTASTEISPSESKVKELHVLPPANTDSTESSSHGSTEIEINDVIPSSSCPCCGRSFHVRAHFLKQIDVYGKGNHLLCLFCQRIYPSWHHLQNHLKRNHRPFLCSSCNFAFRDLVQLNKHAFDFADEKHVICCTYCTNQVCFLANTRAVQSQ